MSVVNKYLIEGLDRLGKDTLIDGILHKRGYHEVLHFSKPKVLSCYLGGPYHRQNLNETEERMYALREYQERSFRNLFTMLSSAPYAHMICNRAHLGENVYAPLYRGYDGAYVFELERAFRLHEVGSIRLILLTEDFSVSSHFVDDGESFDITKREKEQELFMAAFESSIIRDKRVVCVTDRGVGGFRRKEDIIAEALEN
jgi:hypothetical protein